MNSHSSTSNESARAAKRTRACARERTCALVRARSLTLASLIACTLLVSACDAQKPSSTSSYPPSTNPREIAAAEKEGRKYSEPALIGRVIDEQTKQPIAGALIYGHYVVSTGSLGGGTVLGEHVRSFETTTDANGNFKLDAWDTGERLIRGGTPNGRFPAIAVWKPGYALELQGLNSVREFQVRSTAKTAVYAKKSDALIDWSETPFELKPLTDEKARYNALANVGTAMMMKGECGWETYSKTLLAQHIEKKSLIRTFVSPEHVDKDGYVKSGYFHSNPHIDYISRTPLDNLLTKFSKLPKESWKCEEPSKLLTR
jgi:hypothetical protein